MQVWWDHGVGLRRSPAYMKKYASLYRGRVAHSFLISIVVLCCLGRTGIGAASLYDLQQAVSVGSVLVTVRGRPLVAVIAIVPVGLSAFTESWACGTLGAGVVKLLRGTDRR